MMEHYLRGNIQRVIADTHSFVSDTAMPKLKRTLLKYTVLLSHVSGKVMRSTLSFSSSIDLKEQTVGEETGIKK